MSRKTGLVVGCSRYGCFPIVSIIITAFELLIVSSLFIVVLLTSG